jgi:predicted permease
MTEIIQDFRYALRQLRKSPGFACTAILILALGMCGSIAIFGFVDAALIKPLPYANPNRLVEVTESVPMIPHSYLSYPNYLDWKRLNHVFSSMDVYNPTGYLLRTPTGSEPAPGIRVSDGFFHTLGVSPLLGRDFYSGEDLPSAPRTVMLSYAAWQSRFSGRKNVIGETVALSGIPYTIIGVLPSEFQFAPRGTADFWTTLHANDPCSLRRSCHGFKGIGRLKDGISAQTASAEMKAIAAQLEMQYPGDNRGQSAIVTPLSEVVVTNVRPILLALLGGAGLLLLIACVNVSSLLLVRTESRKREIAVRGALGASKRRIVRQLITENLLMASFGGMAGVAVAIDPLAVDELEHEIGLAERSDAGVEQYSAKLRSGIFGETGKAEAL